MTSGDFNTLIGDSAGTSMSTGSNNLFIGEDAIKQALDCSIAIQRLIKKEHEQDPSPVYVGIGINYGPVILGNMWQLKIHNMR